MKKLQIVYADKKSLIPYNNNTKLHTPRQIEQIKNSIREFGFNDPIAVDKNNVVIEGHGRLLAVMDMDEINDVPVIHLDDLTEKQRKAYTIAHNKLTTNTGFDVDLLAKEIASIEDEIDFTDIGFSEAELIELEIDDHPYELFEDTTPHQHAEPSGGNSDLQPDSEAVLQERAEAQSEDEETGRDLSKDEIKAYSENAKQMTTRRIIVIYRTQEEEQFLKDMFGVPHEQSLGVVYDAKNIKML